MWDPGGDRTVERSVPSKEVGWMRVKGWAAALTTMLVAAMAGGCGSGGADKAGGSEAPVSLRLGAVDDSEQPDARFVREFASQVERQSRGAMRVRITWDAGGETADREQRIARMVREGRLDLGWIGSRGWDQAGVLSFQALQAPFLVTDHALFGRIASGPVGARMLRGLEPQGLVGLALVPDRLRYAFGARHALASPEDFAGARLRVQPSRATDVLVRALGAVPVHIDGDELADAVRKGEIDGAEASLGTNAADEGENYLTPNLALFGKAMTLFADREAFQGLDEEQQEVLQSAARATTRYAVEQAPSEAALMKDFCSSRVVDAVNADEADVVRLQERAAKARAVLSKDVETRRLIEAVQALKATTAPEPAATPPPGCTKKAAAVAGPSIPPSEVNGTYHWRVTREGAIAAGGEADDEGIGTVGKMTLRDGRWLMGDEYNESYAGRYEIRGEHLVFDWGGDKLTFRFERDEDGGLRLHAVPPMNVGDRVVWTGGPWRRVGPPVREIP
jgi:C4-dicarboxylate-binding protein DctP